MKPARSFNISPQPSESFKKVMRFQEELVAFFTGGKQLDEEYYLTTRNELLSDSRYGGLAPEWLRPNRDLGALWSFAKSVDASWEPRRRFLRNGFEPLLDYLERNSRPLPTMPGVYDASAWTGVQSQAERAKAIRTLVPVAQASIETIITHLEAPNHNGSPPLDEVDFAINKLKELHTALGYLLTSIDDDSFASKLGDGFLAEIARYGRQAARALKDDPLPYALSGLLLALFSACGFPGTGGYLCGVAAAMRKPVSK